MIHPMPKKVVEIGFEFLGIYITLFKELPKLRGRHLRFSTVHLIRILQALRFYYS